MRILYLTHQYFPRHVGGTEVYLRGLVRRARDAGHDVLVVTCHESESGSRPVRAVETEHEGARVVELHLNLSTQPDVARGEYDNPDVGREVAALIASFRPDVAHALHAMKLSVAALEACHDAGVPLAVSLTDYWFVCPRGTLVDHRGRPCDGPCTPDRCVPCTRDLHGYPAVGDIDSLVTLSRRPLRLRRALLRAARVIALSAEQKRKFVANGYPADRIEVLAHGLETDDLRSAPEREVGWRPLRTVGVVGSVVAHKGTHVVPEALRLAPDLDVECEVHGPLRDDAYSARLRLMARQDPRVKLMGGFEPDRTGAVLGGLDVLAVPALWPENEPLLVKAALHLGVAVLAMPHGSVADLVRRQAGGWLVDGEGPAAWASALRRLAAVGVGPVTPARLKTMDENAAEWLAIYASEARERCAA